MTTETQTDTRPNAQPDMFADENRAATIRLIKRTLDTHGRQSTRSLATLLFDELRAQARDYHQYELFPLHIHA